MRKLQKKSEASEIIERRKLESNMKDLMVMIETTAALRSMDQPKDIRITSCSTAYNSIRGVRFSDIVCELKNTVLRESSSIQVLSLALEAILFSLVNIFLV